MLLFISNKMSANISLHCNETNKLFQYLPVIIFIISFIVFKLYNIYSSDTEEIIRKKKISNMIFEKYKQENKQFFYGN